MDTHVFKKIDFKSNISVKRIMDLNHIIFAWIIFSCFYWTAAYRKPFHVDEFYSWVYAERCSFGEILKLKEFGIGHPPFFHLIQKSMQELIPSYHFTYVRFANFLFGSIFVLILTNWILNRRGSPFFCYGVAISATTLDTFVFSRMWGLVCLCSLVLLQFGEKYLEKRKFRYLFFFMGTVILGFFADYNFILLIPYIFIVLFSQRKYFNRVLIISFILLITGWFATLGTRINFLNSTSLFFWKIFYDLTLMGRELGSILFNFGFTETLLTAFMIFLIAIWFDLRSGNSEAAANATHRNYLYLILAAGIIFIPLNVLNSDETLRMVFAAPVIVLLFLLLFLQARKIHISNLNITVNRLIVAMAGASMIILSVSPVFWKNLKSQRFLLILYPFILLFVFRVCSRKVLHTVSVILIISGVFYVFSNRVSDYYPSPYVKEGSPVLYQSEYGFSTQYLRKKNVSDEPFFIQTYFDDYCKICTMGKDDIDFSGYNGFRFVGRNQFKPGSLIPPGFHPVKRIENLTLFDHIQFKYLTPLHPAYWVTFFYERIFRKDSSAHPSGD